MRQSENCIRLVAVRMPPSLVGQLEKIAAQEMTSVSAIIRRLCARGLNERVAA
jgi:hypothetical protein